MGKVPTTEMVGECGRVVVNTTDVDMYKKQGYKLLADVAEPEQPAELEQPAEPVIEV